MRSKNCLVYLLPECKLFHLLTYNMEHKNIQGLDIKVCPSKK